MSQRKKKRDPTPTRVALVCLKTTQNNIQINNQSLLKIFAKHGSISKILIFERGQLLTKVFIEYDEVNSAIDAIKYAFGLNIVDTLNQQSICIIIIILINEKNNMKTSFILYLNNTKILNQISCNVYHSRLKQLKLDTVPYTKGLDFTNPPSNIIEQCEQIEQQIENNDIILNNNEWQDFQFENRSTDEVSDEEEPQFSEEKMKDIITKLNQIDEEINQTIETKIVTALDKLTQTYQFNKQQENQLIQINQ